ncbi:MAG TPA: recombinase family protein [Isosphaeraceae bacterium]|jgi:DNA invertase Pin-like site-specific DNA recombinase|nr:recombinase family protein [Isosphaeraceae bacterium]
MTPPESPRWEDDRARPERRRLVAYYRVSTQKQGQSGLGLDAQRAAVADYARSSHGQIVREFEEVETSTKDTLDNRPQLRTALELARATKATLVIAKLDRLARNVYVLAGLMESKVDFVACDNPNANKLTVHILAAVAEDEARRISERTRAALAAYKARGGVLGAARPECRNLGADDAARGRALGARAAATAAARDNAAAVVRARALLAEGLSLTAIGARLTEEGYRGRRGGVLRPAQLGRLLARAGIA